MEVFKNASAGPRIAYRSTSLTLQPGKYIVVEHSLISTLFTITSGLNGISDSTYLDETISTNSCTRIDGYHTRNNSNNTSSGVKIIGDSNLVIKYCDIKESTTIQLKTDQYTDDYGVDTTSIQAIKLTNN